MSKYKSFVANGVYSLTDNNKPTVTVYPDPLRTGKFVACIEHTDCDELVNGYSYEELLSIRNAINDALTDIDVRESVVELNKRDPRIDSYRD
jgi:hypothetical protein